jgi:cell fate regulator YaaT (PSP1 superfamily)
LDSPPSGSILRVVSPEDRRQLEQLAEQREQRIASCKREIAAFGLQMKLVEFEQLLGGERIVVYYVAPDRIDFRELVKRLAGEFQTRIEMNQIGVRDEAKLLADYGDSNAPRLDEDGKAAKGDARPDQDFGPLRAAEVLPAV